MRTYRPGIVHLPRSLHGPDDIDTSRAARDDVLRRAQDGDTGALRLLWRIWGVRLPLVEERTNWRPDCAMLARPGGTFGGVQITSHHLTDDARLVKMPPPRHLQPSLRARRLNPASEVYISERRPR